MGWVNTLIQRLFYGNEVIESVRFDDLQLWLDYQAKEIIFKQKLDWEVESYVINLKGERWVLECKLDEWEEMVKKLDNSFQRQEISSFFTETRKLLEILTFAEKIGVQRMITINKIMKKKIEKLLGTVEKSSFAHEYSFIFLEQDKKKNEAIVNPLIQYLIKLNGLREEFERKINSSGIPIIIYLQEKLSRMEEVTAIISKKNQVLKEREDRLRSALTKMKEKEEGLERYKNLPGFSNIQDNRERKSIVLNMKNDCEQKIVDFFELLKPLFEKYVELEPENNLVKDYLVDVVKALVTDESLSLKHILQHLDALFEAGKLGFPLKQELGLRELLEKANEGYLEELRRNYLDITIKLKTLSGNEEGKYHLMRIEEAEYRLAHFSRQVELLGDHVSSLNESIKNDLNELSREKNNFQNIVSTGLRKKIFIIIE